MFACNNFFKNITTLKLFSNSLIYLEKKKNIYVICKYFIKYMFNAFNIIFFLNAVLKESSFFKFCLRNDECIILILH